MRIEKIILKNYRQYRDVELSFRKISDNDLHIVFGKNSAGKTNILNAINWCLYNEEPHLSKSSELLPLLNLKTLENTKEGEKRQAVVELWIQMDSNRRIIFTRKGDYFIHEKILPSKLSSPALEVKIVDESGNTKILAGEEAQNMVERFVPLGIRDFFFFDGERLDNYFRETTGIKVQKAIFRISQMDLLTNVEDHLTKVLKEIQKNAGILNPDVNLLQQTLDIIRSDLTEYEQRMEECKRQIDNAKREIEDRKEKLRGIPDVEKLQRERERIKEKIKEVKKLRDSKFNEKESLLFDLGIILMLYPVIIKSFELIEEKRRKKEIPPTIDKDLIKHILEGGKRCICGRTLDEEAEKSLQHLLKKITLSSQIATELSIMSLPINRAMEKAKNFKTNLKKSQEELQQYDNRMKELNEDLSGIDNQIAGYNDAMAKIKSWYSELKKYELIYEDNLRNLGVFKKEQEAKKKDLEVQEKNLLQELKKEDKYKDLREQITFAQKALQVLNDSREYLMDIIKLRTQAEVERIFLDLIWRKQTFEHVNIDEDYNIHLIHSMGYDSLGSVSAGERELLALAFTIALHKLSGFDFPILIDTPTPRLSSEHKEKFAEIFSKLSKDKQIVLLVLPSEYSDEMRAIFDRVASRYELSVSSDEKEVKVGEI